MSIYLIIKTLHILSSVLLVGTGFGSAFYLYFTNRRGPVAAIASTARLVVRADWWFTTPTVIIQPLTGLWLAHLAGWEWTTPWIALSLILYAIAGLCWLPVVLLQLRMAAMAKAAAAANEELPTLYWRYAHLWERLGYPAFIAMLAIYFLMVLKPEMSV